MVISQMFWLIEFKIEGNYIRWYFFSQFYSILVTRWRWIKAYFTLLARYAPHVAITINPLKTRYAHNLFSDAHITRVIAVQWMYSAIAIVAVNHGEASKNPQPRWNENATCLWARMYATVCIGVGYPRVTALHLRMNYVNYLFAHALSART